MLLAILMMFFGRAVAQSQQNSTPPDTPEPQERNAERSPDTSAYRKHHILWVIPNYRADQTQQSYTPLTTTEKYHIARSDSFDWPNYFLLAGYALQSQIASGVTLCGTMCFSRRLPNLMPPIKTIDFLNPQATSTLHK